MIFRHRSFFVPTKYPTIKISLILLRPIQGFKLSTYQISLKTVHRFQSEDVTTRQTNRLSSSYVYNTGI